MRLSPLFDRPVTGERAVLVSMALQTGQNNLDELKELASTAGADPISVVTGSRKMPTPKYFIGTGKLAELAEIIATKAIDVVLFNHVLSPRQESNLEQELNTRVIDRNGLILDIFAQRAQTYEGKLQVELAQLRHLSTRLIRSWTHLERQGGGIGMRGPGETQLETDRRLIRIRIKHIQGRLDKVAKQRHQGRIQRKSAGMATISLVGYTNAGKSTLFNQLTGADIYVKDQLFATLGPTLRKCVLANGSTVIMADTVGFIRQLPHELIASFRSTLQEASEAQLLLHVVDANAEDRADTIEQVNQVLTQINADSIKQLQVFNKIDLLPDFEPKLERDEDGVPKRVWLSAQSGVGIDLLTQALQEFYADKKIKVQCHLAPTEGALHAKLHQFAHIISEKIDQEGGWQLEVDIDKKYLGLLKRLKIK